MTLLMEHVYGKEEYKKSGHSSWGKVAEKPTYVDVAEQGGNECGYFCLKFAYTLNGYELGEKIQNQDVCNFRKPIFNVAIFLYLFCLL